MAFETIRLEMLVYLVADSGFLTSCFVHLSRMNRSVLLRGLQSVRRECKRVVHQYEDREKIRLGATACRDRCTAHALHSRSVSPSLTRGIRVLLFLALPLFHCLLVQWRGWISRRSSRGDAKSESNDKIVGRKGS